MAADMMKFDTGEAAGVKGELENSARKIDEILGDVKNILTSAAEWWKGDSVEAYMDQYQRIETPVKGLIEAVETIAKQIQATIDDKNTQEQELSSILSQSFN